MTTTRRTSDPSAKILSIRLAYGGDADHCPTCTRAPDAPHRVFDARGHVVEGCIDAIHTGRVYGASADWQNSPQAVALRRANLARLQAL